MSPERGYHHGDLRAALVEASFDLLAECGLRRFSVAAVARRLGVSSAAPYRHFADRRQLLSAVSSAAARDLRAAIEAAADAAGDDPAARLAAAAGAYVRYVARTGAGFHVIFAAELYDVADDARREQTRALMTTLLDLGEAVDSAGGEAGDGPGGEAGGGARTYPEVVLLVEATIAVAHGYTSLFADGFFARNSSTVDDIAARAVEAAGALISH
ncbi:helix-turn-helix domain-containing protein [Actinoplanes sp. NPDC023936]|uniref:TetR/AcrR family transcriptional regulator n=1 Tax=Actinoplanes sp. NPDC023936 TaxID=3154910 RepID=UPI0033E5FA9C